MIEAQKPVMAIDRHADRVEAQIARVQSRWAAFLQPGACETAQARSLPVAKAF